MAMELLSHNASSPDPLHQEVIYKRPLAYAKMEGLIKEMQDPEHGVPVRCQKIFLTSIPAAFAGYDIIEWLMERLNIEDSGEAIHMANLLCQHGYFFPVGDNRTLSVKDDSSLYRFQTPYYWPSQVPCLDSVDYAIYLAKRTMRNKQKHGLEDYEVEALNQLRKTLALKWDFISMQADEQVRISKERKKVDKVVTDAQERAFWRVLRPPPGTTSCVETPPIHMADFHSHEGVKQVRRTNILEDLRAEVDLLRTSCIRTRIKVSQALESLASHCESYNEHDPFLVPRQPSNPWVSDDPTFWIINAPLVEIPTERRVKKWSISMEDLVYDPTGRRELTAYLQKEYCHENIRFWIAVHEMRYGPAAQLRTKAQHIYNEFLSPGAPCEINIDMRTMEAVQKEMSFSSPSRFTFDPAADHVYTLLLKKDCYPRFIRSDHYKALLANALQLNQKKRFFSFAPGIGKKKSSATSAPIFPVGVNSATAGVGEVLKVTDEMILITTGNKADLLSASSQDMDKLSLLADCPYRGDLIPDERRDNDSVINTLSQGSVDDVCPWESMEKLPDRGEKQAPPSISATSSAVKSAIVTAATSAPIAIPVKSQPQQTHQIPVDASPKRSKNETASVPSTSAGMTAIPAVTAAIASSVSQTDMKTCEVNKSGRISKQSSVTSNKGDDVTDDNKTRRGSCMATPVPGMTSCQSLSGHSLLIEVVGSPPKFIGSPPRTVASSDVTVVEVKPPQPKKTMKRGSLTKGESSDGEKKSTDNLVDVCPWDHENGSKAETTTFVKTYSTLGYL